MEEYSTGRKTVWCLRQTPAGYAWFWFDRGKWLELGCLGTFERITAGRRYMVEICKPYFCTRIRKDPPNAATQKITINMDPELAWRMKAVGQLLNLSVADLIKHVFITWSSPGEFRTLDRERILEALEARRDRLQL